MSGQQTWLCPWCAGSSMVATVVANNGRCPKCGKHVVRIVDGKLVEAGQ